MYQQQFISRTIADTHLSADVLDVNNYYYSLISSGSKTAANGSLEPLLMTVFVVVMFCCNRQSQKR
jgi:hypothetical protein